MKIKITWDLENATKAVWRGKFIVPATYMRKEEKSGFPVKSLKSKSKLNLTM